MKYFSEMKFWLSKNKNFVQGNAFSKEAKFLFVKIKNVHCSNFYKSIYNLLINP